MSRIHYSVNQPFTKRWIELVGKAVLNFGSMEFETYLWLAQMSEDPSRYDEFTKKWLKGRVSLIQEFVTARAFSEKWKEEAKESWESALELATFRNQIVHNPLIFNEETDSLSTPTIAGIVDVEERLVDPIITEKVINERINQTSALVQNLANLRQEWCEVRDNQMEGGT